MCFNYSQASYDRDRYTEQYLATQPADAAKDKVVAVTGATGNGLGLKFAMNAARLGASKVVLLNRASERALKAEAMLKAAAPDTCHVVTVECDLTSLDSVRAVAPKLSEACGGALDVLMLNAGVMASPDETTADGYNREVQLNVIAQLLLLKGAMPLLEAAAELCGEARICTQTSGARKIGGGILPVFFDKVPAGGLPAPLGGDVSKGMFSIPPAWVRYGQTKLANAMSAMILHEKLHAKGSKVKALSVAPGLAATDLQETTQKMGAMKAWQIHLMFLLRGQSANDGALPMTHACLMPDVESGSMYQPSFQHGGFGPPMCIASQGKFMPEYVKGDVHTISTDEEKAAFWEMIEKACGGPIV
mmetsp:Transcript_7348/g.22720  ORF Transcript_7348/g.22720 Transcript_7348/m.22720 type:complete len:361 (-) Transcript_7348:661-1743(-)